MKTTYNINTADNALAVIPLSKKHGSKKQCATSNHWQRIELQHKQKLLATTAHNTQHH